MASQTADIIARSGIAGAELIARSGARVAELTARRGTGLEGLAEGISQLGDTFQKGAEEADFNKISDVVASNKAGGGDVASLIEALGVVGGTLRTTAGKQRVAEMTTSLGETQATEQFRTAQLNLRKQALGVQQKVADRQALQSSAKAFIDVRNIPLQTREALADIELKEAKAKAFAEGDVPASDETRLFYEELTGFVFPPNWTDAQIFNAARFDQSERRLDESILGREGVETRSLRNLEFQRERATKTDARLKAARDRTFGLDSKKDRNRIKDMINDLEEEQRRLEKEQRALDKSLLTPGLRRPDPDKITKLEGKITDGWDALDVKIKELEDELEKLGAGQPEEGEEETETGATPGTEERSEVDQLGDIVKKRMKELKAGKK